MKQIDILTKPVSINQRYTISRGKNILTRNYRDAKEAIKWEVTAQWQGEPIEDDVTINFLIYYKGRKPDIDAYHKIVLDAMSEIVYKDDKQIDELHTFRMKSGDDRIVIQVL